MDLREINWSRLYSLCTSLSRTQQQTSRRIEPETRTKRPRPGSDRFWMGFGHQLFSETAVLPPRATALLSPSPDRTAQGQVGQDLPVLTMTDDSAGGKWPLLRQSVYLRPSRTIAPADSSLTDGVFRAPGGSASPALFADAAPADTQGEINRTWRSRHFLAVRAWPWGFCS